MARMSGNGKFPSEMFGDRLQYTNWILDYEASGHMPPEVSDFITGSLEDTDKYIEVADGHHVTAKQKVQVQIKMCNDNGYSFIAMLHNVMFYPDLCNSLFSIITLMYSEHTCLFHKGFCTLYLGAKENNAVTFPHIAQSKHVFLGKIKVMSKKKKLLSRKKIALKLIFQ